MPLIAYTVIADTAVDPDSPLDSALVTALRDNIAHVRDYVGGVDYVAARNHNHDGINSAESEVGSNSVRNGSFESGIASWTTVSYSGQPIVVNTAASHDGAASLEITSTSTAVGGGEAVSAPIACSGQVGILVKAMLSASVANVSSSVRVQWLNAAKAQISEDIVYSATSTPTAVLPIAEMMSSPAAARYYRVRVIGGVPATGSATGTVRFDGVFGHPLNGLAVPGTKKRYSDTAVKTSTGAGFSEQINLYVPVGGTYRISFDLRGTGTPGFYTGYGRIYIDGVATGTLWTRISATFATFTEDLYVPPGSTLQLFLQTSDTVQPAEAKNFSLATANKISTFPYSIAIGDR